MFHSGRTMDVSAAFGAAYRKFAAVFPAQRKTRLDQDSGVPDCKRPYYSLDNSDSLPHNTITIDVDSYIEAQTPIEQMVPGGIIVMCGLTTKSGVKMNGRLGVLKAKHGDSWAVLAERGVPSSERLMQSKNIRHVAVAACQPPTVGDVGKFNFLERSLLLQEMMKFLDCPGLCSLRACGRQSYQWDAEFDGYVWKNMCATTWATKASRFHLTEERQAELEAAFPGACWRQLYHHHVAARNDALNLQELLDLSWAFNLRPEAGGRGLATAQIVQFQQKGPPASPKGDLLISGLPPLPFAFDGDRKLLNIGTFPPHSVERLPDWEWCISNENVIFVSGTMTSVEACSNHDRLV